MAESRRRDGADGTHRTMPDACPGAWRRHEAADGALARFRPAGGAVTAAELRLLASAAATGGSPIELTSRGSLQVRGLAASTADDLASGLRHARTHGGDGPRHRTPAAPLLDALGRELPCGLIASPRSGRGVPVPPTAVPPSGDSGPHVHRNLHAAPGAPDHAAPGDGALRPGGQDHEPHADVDPWVADVADGLRGRTDLPGRFLVALDDGRGDVSGQGADVTLVARPSGVALLLDGADTGLRVPPAEAPALALAAVDAFLAVRGTAWRMAEIPTDGVVDGLRRRVRTTTAAPEVRPGRPEPPTLGLDVVGTCELLPRLGEIPSELSAALVELLEDTGATLRITPWRTLVVRDLPDPGAARERLGGLAETDPTSPWAGLSACVGAPRCAKSLADVRGDLAAAVATRRAGGRGREHWVGCARACGTPAGRVAVVEAVDGVDSRTLGVSDATPLTPRYRTTVRSGKVEQ